MRGATTFLPPCNFLTGSLQYLRRVDAACIFSVTAVETRVGTGAYSRPMKGRTGDANPFDDLWRMTVMAWYGTFSPTLVYSDDRLPDPLVAHFAHFFRNYSMAHCC